MEGATRRGVSVGARGATAHRRFFIRLFVKLWAAAVLAVLGCGLARADEFVGPFASWANVKADYRAVGDGRADDTAPLQKALDDLGRDKQPKVLYLPAGTYRITSGLTVKSRMYVSIIGEDPARTTIKWDGAAGGVMLTLDGVAYSRFDRLSWDGGGKALVAIDQAWDGATPYFDTGNEYADDYFRDVGYGIRGGNLGHGAAESSVLRCHFLRNTAAGIIVKNFNALDWFVWYSTFESCNVGVTNSPGAGNFHVFNSLFRDSARADILIANTSYFSIRGNTSVGSKAFFVGLGVGRNGALTTIQGNAVLDARDPTPINIENFGPVLLLDNVISSRAEVAGEPVVRHVVTFRWDAPDTVSIGNTFTSANPVVSNGRLLTIDDRVVARGSVNPGVPAPPDTLPNLHRRTFEVPAGADGAAIQQAIESAARQSGSRPVVHLPAGNYAVDRTLVIPAGSDVQLVGDGYGSALVWAGKSVGPVLLLAGPSKATVRDLQVLGAGAGDGVVVDNADQPGARVFAEQCYVASTRQVGLLVDGLDYTNVELHDFFHAGSKGVAVKVVGGRSAAKGTWLGGRTNIFAGASSNNNLSYDVTDGGRLLARDIWYETNSLPRFISLSDAGTFTLHGAMIATAVSGDVPAVEVRNFRGRVTVLTAILYGRIVVEGDGSDTRLLALGLQGHTDGYFVNNSPRALVALMNSREYLSDSGTRAVRNEGAASAAFVREMLAQTRGEQPRLPTALASGVTDVRLYRVRIENCPEGLHLRSGGGPIPTTPRAPVAATRMPGSSAGGL
jgi:hypothetical protein